MSIFWWILLGGVIFFVGSCGIVSVLALAFAAREKDIPKQSDEKEQFFPE